MYDNCGICGGDGSNCENPEATLSFGDLGGDVMLQISYVESIEDVCIVSPILSDPLGSGVSTLVGECVSSLES